MSQPTFRIRCVCGVKGEIAIPYQPLALAQFVEAHETDDNMRHGSAVLTCCCGAETQCGPSSPVSMYDFLHWVDEHANCKVAA
jgi:hypothetical protein